MIQLIHARRSSVNEDKPVFDKNTLIAVVLMMGVWFGWSAYLSKKYPNANKAAVVAENKTGVEASSGAPTAATIQNNQQTDPQQQAGSPSNSMAVDKAAQTQASYEEKFVELNSENLKIKLSSLGLGLVSVETLKFSDRENKNINLNSQYKYGQFASILNDQAVPFEIIEQTENKIVGQANVNGSLIRKELVFDDKTYSITSTTKIDSADKAYVYKSLISTDTKKPIEQSILAPSFDHQEFYVLHDNVESREIFDLSKDAFVDHSDYNAAKVLKRASVAASATQYFAAAIVDNSDIIPDFKVEILKNDKITNAYLQYTPINSGNITVNQKYYIGPKQVDNLNFVDAKLGKLVNLGFFGWIAFPLLKLLNFFYSISSNFGIAIILLTILVRIAVLPFNLMSYRYMKAMQVLQPHIQKLKEKYKDDQVRMNQEMMLLMKEHKANPVTGCLPMFLQLPVFFALYQVLGQSIELYKSPFMLWIHDLSLKDPYYVLPILMGVTMFIQSKITPTTMDPQQAKIMAFMPVVFSLLMVSLPSGLTLYIFISTLFAIIQQKAFMSADKKKENATLVKA